MPDAADPLAPATPAGTNTAADVEAKVTTTRVQQRDPPIDHMPRAGVILLTLYFILFGIISVDVLVNVWPAPEPEPSIEAAAVTTDSGGAAPLPTAGAPAADACPGVRICTDSVSMLRGLVKVDFTGRAELRLIIIALFAGGLGALISTGLSFASYLGARRLDQWYTVWYILRPPVGMALALLTYFLLRAGLLNPGASVNQVSPYGVAAIGGLMGMFIKEATDKLKDVATALFKSDENQLRTHPLGGEKRTDVTKTDAEITRSPAAEAAAAGLTPPPTTASGAPPSTPSGHHPDPGA
jgi:hypothetical protein